MDPGTVLATIPKLIATHTSKLAYNYLASRVKERIERNWELMSKDMCEKVTPDNPLRNDWFAENEVLNNHIPFRLLEKTIREITNDSEERKSPHIAKFWVNVCLTSNADIDQATAFSYFETIEALSWRQLCIIRIIALNDSKKIDRHSKISDEKVENLSDDQRMKFHAIGREYQELMDNHYIDGTAMPHVSSQDKWNREPWLDAPELWGMPNYTKRFHDLMDLNEISDREITEIFSIWGVKLKN